MEEPLVDVAPSCRVPYAKVVPCTLSTRRTLAFDTATVPNGAHAIQIAAYDAGGNRTLSPAAVVTTLNGSEPNGSGATRRARLSARIVTRSGRVARERATVDFGARRTIRGRLTDANGNPIAAARLGITGQALRTGARIRREGSVVTDAKGRFVFRARRGPSRILRVGYRAFTLDEAPSAVAERDAERACRHSSEGRASSHDVARDDPVRREAAGWPRQTGRAGHALRGGKGRKAARAGVCPANEPQGPVSLQVPLPAHLRTVHVPVPGAG